MRVYLGFSGDEIRNEIPYEIIGETASRSIWDTGKRKRRWASEFSEREREICYRLISQAKSWYLRTGCPEEVKMTQETYYMWFRLANFCASL